MNCQKYYARNFIRDNSTVDLNSDLGGSSLFRFLSPKEEIFEIKLGLKSNSKNKGDMKKKQLKGKKSESS